MSPSPEARNYWLWTHETRIKNVGTCRWTWRLPMLRLTSRVVFQFSLTDAYCIIVFNGNTVIELDGARQSLPSQIRVCNWV